MMPTTRLFPEAMPLPMPLRRDAMALGAPRASGFLAAH
jgi:hypothetical protein